MRDYKFYIPNPRLLFSSYKPGFDTNRPIFFRSGLLSDVFLGKKAFVHDGLNFRFIFVKPEHLFYPVGSFVFTKKTGMRIHIDKSKKDRKKLWLLTSLLLSGWAELKIGPFKPLLVTTTTITFPINFANLLILFFLTLLFAIGALRIVIQLVTFPPSQFKFKHSCRMLRFPILFRLFLVVHFFLTIEDMVEPNSDTVLVRFLTRVVLSLRNQLNLPFENEIFFLIHLDPIHFCPLHFLPGRNIPFILCDFLDCVDFAVIHVQSAHFLLIFTIILLAKVLLDFVIILFLVGFSQNFFFHFAILLFFFLLIMSPHVIIQQIFI